MIHAMPILVRGAIVALALFVSSTAAAQTPPADRPATSTTPAASIAPDDPQVRTVVTVVAQKEPADASTLPVSLTVLPRELLKAIGVSFIADAAAWSPNTHFTEFTARKLSNPRIRGIGASPANPGVTTYVDGVPQFNANTTSFDLIDVGQIEFVRGPQSALFGRNALGGVINITSTRPSMTEWGGELTVPFGSESEVGFRANVSGPLQEGKLAVGFAAAFGQREGFTRDVLAGTDIDSRESIAAKGQVLWTPSSAWEARVIVSGERARDGDYALNDLAAVRANPFEVSRDFFGHTDRDLFSTSIVARHQGPRTTFTSTTGLVRWKTFDETDLDYSFFPLATRANREEATQFTQEVRWASAAGAPVRFSDSVSLRWQVGGLAFMQGFDQNAVNNIAPFVLSPFIDFPVALTSPAAALDDRGLGIYGQATFGFGGRVDVGLSARADRERKNADILTAYSPMIAPDVRVVQERTFSDVSPNVSVAVHLRRGSMLFASAGRAFKAGGFNPVSLPGDEAYDEEHAWNVEGGIRTGTSNGRFAASASVFSIDWDGLQLNLPVFGAPGQFFIDNVGAAASRGVEIELASRPTDWLDLFSAVGVTRARFSPGTISGGLDVSGNTVPNTPAYTATFGAQYSNEFRPGHRFFARADVALTGAFEYDEANTERQDAYTLTNFRAGFRARWVIVEGWVRNAFDTRYVPLAFPYQFSSSGFIGEPGRPRTFGISLGIGF
jgi:iron complex outermembrane receptor protein